ncbi:MAG: hypothetical protein JNL61_05645 [Rhizobiaceae bacterium]|nr:hypothetical protein [Rhizobiaceae bacterium]
MFDLPAGGHAPGGAVKLADPQRLTGDRCGEREKEAKNAEHTMCCDWAPAVKT